MTDNAVPLPEDISIWHYRQFAEFVSILQKEALWFSRLDRLRDPFEGRFGPTFKGQFWETAEAHTRKGCVSCWTIDEGESELMWYAYAPNFGVAIRSTKGSLKNSLKSPYGDKVVIGVVEYEPTQWAEGRPDFAFVKRRGFQREQELRALIPYEHEFDRGRIVEPTSAGKLVSVELRSLMAEVWVAPSSPNWFERVVRTELEKYGYGYIPVKKRV